MTTEIDLKEYLEKIICLRFADLDRRLEGMNEVRQQLAAQKVQFLSRDVYEVEHSKLKDEILELKQVENRMKAYVMGVTAAAMVIAAVLDFAIRSYMAMK